MTPTQAVQPTRRDAFALGLLLFILALPYVFSTGYFEDEFSSLNHAKRMLAGAVIYRDFFEPTAPLLHWTAVALFTLWKPSLLPARLLQALMLVLSGIQLQALSRHLGIARWTSALPGLVLVLALFRLWPGYSHHWMVLPFTLGALQAAMKAFRSDKLGYWAFTGLLTGIATLWVQSDGVVLFLGLAGATLLDGWLRHQPLRRLAKTLGMLGVAWGLPIGLAALYFWSQGALYAAWYALWIFPLTHYRVAGGINDVSFGSDLPDLLLPIMPRLGWLARSFHFVALFAIFPVALCFAACYLAAASYSRWQARELPAWYRSEMSALALCSVVLILLAFRGRADFIHVAEYAIVPLLLLLSGARTLVQKSRWLGCLCMATVVAFGATGAGLYASQIVQAPATYLIFSNPDRGADERPLIPYLRAHTVPGDTIVMLPYGGYTAFYTRPLATRYTLMVPPELGYHTVQEYRAFWRDVVAARPKYIVLSSCGNEALMLKSYRSLMPPNYVLVTQLPNPQFGPTVPAYIYERQPISRPTGAPKRNPAG